MSSTQATVYETRSLAAWIIGGLSFFVFALVATLLLTPISAFVRSTFLIEPRVHWLPHLNAGLNAANVILLSAAYLFIRKRRIGLHRWSMLGAFGLSTLFLASYVIYHAFSGPTRFSGSELLRPIYYTMLTSHIILAAAVLPLALTTLYRGWFGIYAPHRRIARWTLPVWLYVSATGVAIYLMLY